MLLMAFTPVINGGECLAAFLFFTLGLQLRIVPSSCSRQSLPL